MTILPYNANTQQITSIGHSGILNAKSLADLIISLDTLLPASVDITVLAQSIGKVLTANNAKFKPYFAVLSDLEHKYIMTKFDTTAEYFFDRINRGALTKEFVENLINQTIIF